MGPARLVGARRGWAGLGALIMADKSLAHDAPSPVS